MQFSLGVVPRFASVVVHEHVTSNFKEIGYG